MHFKIIIIQHPPFTFLLSAVSCDKLSEPSHGRMKCSGLYGSYSLNSSCQFFCTAGYKLSGTADLHCNSSGAWSAPPPTCAGTKYQLSMVTNDIGTEFTCYICPIAVECYPLFIFGGGLMNCTEGHDTYRSTCRVQCPPGHLLMGFAEFNCRADGTWTSSFPLICASEEFNF